ncbi:MAG: hypothetical protein QM708_01115 [Propioniciclava sp.]|uniref:hypothetical protein n=1 Tax=Propioniciclava sp. TaxID=2038686 RepID=UPI0039E39BC0
MTVPEGPSASGLPDVNVPAPRAGQIAFWAATAGYSVLIVWQAFTLPDAVPGPLDFKDEVTRWWSRTAHVVLGASVGALTVVTCMIVPSDRIRTTALLTRPQKAHWRREENLPAARRMLRDDLGWMGAVGLTFAGYTLWTAGAAAVGQAPPMWTFITGLIMVVSVLLGYVGWMNFGPRWRPPAEPPDADHPYRPR